MDEVREKQQAITCTASHNAAPRLYVQVLLRQQAFRNFKQQSYLVVELTQMPFPSVSALMHTPPLLLQSFEQTVVWPFGVDVLSARKFHTNLEMSSTWLGEGVEEGSPRTTPT